MRVEAYIIARHYSYQQNLTGRRIGLIVLSTNYWPVIRDNVPHILAAVEQAGRERYLEVDLPRPTLLRRPPPAANR